LKELAVGLAEWHLLQSEHHPIRMIIAPYSHQGRMFCTENRETVIVVGMRDWDGVNDDGWLSGLTRRQ